MSDESPRTQMAVLEQVRTMQWNFWVANVIEAFERLAFFGVRAVVPLYMYGADSVLQLSMTEKNWIFGTWALIQCLVPMVSGGYTDAYGYRKSMYVAFSINIAGYCLMANATGFWSMMAAACCVGLGTAIFKPPVQGSVAKSLNAGNSGLGFGIFYWMVNVGGFFAPMLASYVRGNDLNPTWGNVFYGAAIVTAINFLPATLLFREPELDPEARKKNPFKVFAETMGTLWRDQKMLRFLLIISGFWLMFMQLWDLLPNFIDEWVDTRDVGALIAQLPFEGAGNWLDADGGAKPELLINIDSFTILLLVLPLSWFFGRFRMMFALMLGMLIALFGFVGAGLTQVGMLVAVAIFVFAIGEIICSPKFSEYIGMIAPPDKKAIYMGYSNIPFAVGWAAGNWLSGPLYDRFSSKINLAKRYLVDHAGMSSDAVDQIEPTELLGQVAAQIGADASAHDATRLLWETYNPWIIWVMLGAVGLTSVLGMSVGYFKQRAG